jgi:hypothetical protein
MRKPAPRRLTLGFVNPKIPADLFNGGQSQAVGASVSGSAGSLMVAVKIGSQQFIL